MSVEAKTYEAVEAVWAALAESLPGVRFPCPCGGYLLHGGFCDVCGNRGWFAARPHLETLLAAMAEARWTTGTVGEPLRLRGYKKIPAPLADRADKWYWSWKHPSHSGVRWYALGDTPLEAASRAALKALMAQDNIGMAKAMGPKQAEAFQAKEDNDAPSN